MESDSLISCQLWNLTLWCPAYCRIWLCGVLPTVLWNLTPWCTAYFEISLTDIRIWLFGVLLTEKSATLCPAYICEIWHCGVLPTVKSDSAVSCLMWNLTLRSPAYCEIWLRGVLPTVKFDSTVSCPPSSRFKTVLACFSGAKTLDRLCSLTKYISKISWHLPC